MGIIDHLKSLFDDKGFFIIRDASFGVVGAVISGCFFKEIHFCAFSGEWSCLYVSTNDYKTCS